MVGWKKVRRAETDQGRSRGRRIEGEGRKEGRKEERSLREREGGRQGLGKAGWRP